MISGLASLSAEKLSLPVLKNRWRIRHIVRWWWSWVVSRESARIAKLNCQTHICSPGVWRYNAVEMAGNRQKAETIYGYQWQFAFLHITTTHLIDVSSALTVRDALLWCIRIATSHHYPMINCIVILFHISSVRSTLLSTPKSSDLVYLFPV